jgi:hypothetical protein
MPIVLVTLMNGISLKAWHNATYVSLAELLIVIGRFVLRLRWKLHLQEVSPGPGSVVLESLWPNRELDTFELLHVVTPSVQIIDGEILGYDSQGKLALTLRAVDSSSWDIETDNQQILRLILEMYPDAVSLSS